MAAKPDFSQGPIRKIFNAGVKAYEDIRGLNVGGKESGRRARKIAARRNVIRLPEDKYSPLWEERRRTGK